MKMICCHFNVIHNNVSKVAKMTTSDAVCNEIFINMMRFQCSLAWDVLFVCKNKFLSIYLGWGLLKLRSLISPWAKFSILQKYLLYSLNHIHIWQMSPQLSCGDTCQIWTRYSIVNVCFDNNGKYGKFRNGDNWLSNPHPCSLWHCYDVCNIVLYWTVL